MKPTSEILAIDKARTQSGDRRREGEVYPGYLYGYDKSGALSANSRALSAYRSPTAFSVIKRRAEMVASLEWRVEWDDPRTPQGDFRPVPKNHWLVSLLQRPNQELVRSNLIRLISKWLDINGNAYVYTPTYPGMPGPSEMWVLPSNRVSVVPGTDRLIEGYLFQSRGRRWAIDADHVLHLKTPEPDPDPAYSMYLGRSLLLAAIESTELEMQVARYGATYLGNDALPAFAVQSPEYMDYDEFTAFKKMWDETFAGANRRGRWALLDGGKTIETFQGGGQLQDLAELHAPTMERICMVLGYPAAALTWKDMNYATAREMQQSIFETIMKPHAQYIGEEMTLHFGATESGLTVSPIFPEAPIARDVAERSVRLIFE